MYRHWVANGFEYKELWAFLLILTQFMLDPPNSYWVRTEALGPQIGTTGCLREDHSSFEIFKTLMIKSGFKFVCTSFLPSLHWFVLGHTYGDLWLLYTANWKWQTCFWSTGIYISDKQTGQTSLISESSVLDKWEFACFQIISSPDRDTVLVDRSCSYWFVVRERANWFIQLSQHSLFVFDRIASWTFFRHS